MTDTTGSYLRPGEAGFPEAVAARLFNGRRPDRWPAAVLRAAGVADVAAGVRRARAEGWQVTVRSGGHRLAGLVGARRRPRHRPGRPHPDDVRRDDGAGHRRTRRARGRPGRLSRRARPLLPGRPCSDRRPGRVPPAGRLGLGLSRLGLVSGAGGVGRRGPRVRGAGALLGDRERRPVLGRTRQRAGLSRHRHRACACTPEPGTGRSRTRRSPSRRGWPERC
ncbi:hypothetical protein [Nocardioides convexus]|uniref:hypothetical protein n=1 Tax=Nocardioides convexus TaxID=2712224 RepID=UPI0024188302|nr:hypothetical protein [Nocardioides convexus]